jgi:hypothetical protein
MSEQERQLIIKMATYIVENSIKNRKEIINYNDVSKNMNVPIQIIKTAASKICKCAMRSSYVDDIDCRDNEFFEIILKRKIA